MTSHLREELDRLADSAPRIDVDPSTWDRGRAVRRRDRALLVAAVLALIASVGGLGALVTRPASVGPADGDVVPGGAIPSRILAVPPDMTARLPSGTPEQPLEQGWVVGRSSAAFIADDLPVLVSAGDGRYHLVALPGWREESTALALSPNGTRLAWQDHNAGGSTLTVMELKSGEHLSVNVAQGPAFRLRDLTWSPDSSWLAWIGDGAAGSVAGRWKADEAPTRLLRFAGTVTDISVSDEGQLLLGTDGELAHVVGRTRRVVAATRDVGAGAFSPAGDQVALRSTPSEASYTLDLGQDRVLRHPFPDDTIDRAAVRPMGWVDGTRQLLLVQTEPGADAELVITTPEVNQTSTWRRSVGTVAPEAASSLTLAVDLVPDLDGTSSQRFTHDFGEPVWPGSMSERLPVLLGALVVLLAGLVLVRVLRSRAVDRAPRRW